jgi:hypothetical protein
VQETDRRRQRRREHDWLCRTRKKDHALLGAPKVPLKRLTPGTVVWAHVPYEHGDGEKLRPAVVVERQGRQVRIRRLSSSASRFRYDFYVDLEDLPSAGLDRPCGIDLRSTMVVDLIELVDISGALSDADFLRLQVSACLYDFLETRPSAGAGTADAEVRDLVGSTPCR